MHADSCMHASCVCLLDDLGLLCFRGPDARPFLQGQLSNDVAALRAGQLLRAGLHSPQGRTLALLALAAGSTDDEIFAILPRELITAVAATLTRYVLRSKVKISDASTEHRVYGAAHRHGARADAGRCPSSVLHGYASERELIMVQASDPAPAGAPLTRAEWRALDIAAGLPQVYQATSGQFVAQMLNLDCIDAVSFNKGCYTGQEVIARSHFRGRVKRRMQRFVSAEPLRLTPGQSGQLADGRSFRVVDASERADGRCEFLAVAPLAAAATATATASASASAARAGATEGTPETAAAVTPILAEELALPYALPE
jgi:tRNA-modifying protein YgfZ